MAEEYQISPRVTVRKGNAVKLERRRGLYRFVKTIDRSDGQVLTAEIVGPIGGREVTRLVPVGDLRSAGKTPASEVEMSFEQRELVQRAQSRRRS